MTVIATPPKDATFCAVDFVGAIGNDAATSASIVATTPKDAILGTGKPRDTNPTL
jgi:hypothetical protein